MAKAIRPINAATTAVKATTSNMAALRSCLCGYPALSLPLRLVPGQSDLGLRRLRTLRINTQAPQASNIVKMSTSTSLKLALIQISS